MKINSFLSIIFITAQLSGCSFHYTAYQRESLTYNSKVKSIAIKGDVCELELDPPSLGKGKITDAKAKECANLSIGDDVTINEVTLNNKHTTRVLKGIWFNLP